MVRALKLLGQRLNFAISRFHRSVKGTRLLDSLPRDSVSSLAPAIAGAELLFYRSRRGFFKCVHDLQAFSCCCCFDRGAERLAPASERRSRKWSCATPAGTSAARHQFEQVVRGSTDPSAYTQQ